MRIPREWCAAAMSLWFASSVARAQRQASRLDTERPIVVRHVGIIDGTGAPLQRDMTMVIAHRHIAALGRDGRVPIPARAIRVDGRGLFAVAGLWDMHAHLTTRGELAFLLSRGITSVRDMGSVITLVKPWRDSIAAGLLDGPRIKTSGPVLESPKSIEAMSAAQVKHGDGADVAWRISVPSPNEAQHAVDSVADLGADFLKARTYADVETYFAIAAAARRRGIMFVGHPPYGLPTTADVVSDSGQRTLEHGFYPDRVDTLSSASLARVTSAYRRNGTVLVPTLITWEAHRIPADSAATLRPETSCGPMPRDVLANVTKRWATYSFERGTSRESKELMGIWNTVLDRHFRDLATLYAAGIPILPGTDVPGFACPHIALNRELEMFVSSIGMTPLQAIQSATIAPAKLFSMQDSLGTLERGKLADIVLLSANPLLDIRNLRRVHTVIANGVILRDMPTREQDL